jgi:hypothetical protein
MNVVFMCIFKDCGDFKMARKLTSSMLEKIVKEEVSKIHRAKTPAEAAKHTKETKASDYAGTIEHQVDFLKALKIEESRLVKRLEKIREQKKEIATKIANG